MHFTVSIPTCREGLSIPLPFADIDDIVRISQEAERLGYHSVWANDHITAPRYVREAYSDPPRFFEPMIVLSYVAAHTRSIKLATAVLVLPMREPVFFAKQVATLDQASNGRVLLGIGVGAYREEFEALKPDLSDANRGEMLVEGAQVLRKLFDERVASWTGRYYRFSNIELYPKPKQDPFPIYFGGNHPNQIERTVRYGNGWLPASIPPNTVADGVRRLQAAAEAVGRDPGSFVVAPQVMVCIARTREEAIRNFEASPMYRHLHTLRASTLREVDMDRLVQMNLVGSPDDIIERVSAFQEAGASMMASMTFISPSVSAMLDDMQFFAEEVFPAFNGQRSEAA
jgi:probable F420-dependent oxidoreductase